MEVSISFLKAEEKSQNINWYVVLFRGKEETAHTASFPRFWRKLTKSVYGERRTKPVVEGLL